MARQRTCVHDREYQDSFAVNRENDRGPIIMPKGSWCFACDGKGKNGSWKPARLLRFEELMALDDEHMTERDDEPLPSLALPRRGQWPTIKVTTPIDIDFDAEDQQAISRYIRSELESAFDNMMFFGEPWSVTELRDTKPERKPMAFKRATYTVPQYTRQVELKFEQPITSMPMLDYSVFPPRFIGGSMPTRDLNIKVPGNLDRLLIIVDEQEMKDFENFRKLKDVTARIKKVSAEIRSHEDQQERCERAAGKAYEEKSRLTREQQNLSLTSGIK